mmetsp:Transcript_42928/g.100773  ORF Transcript_42928/g.100773 Transcript_42928/m.100773 type:complete len:231 (-) Transcript_42928:179-871(-)
MSLSDSSRIHALATKPSTFSSFLTRTSFFHRRVNEIFDKYDVDGKGSIDKTELYSAVLEIHLRIGWYGAGAAACNPPSRDFVEQIFLQYDTDASSTIERKEFLKLMIVLCTNITFRITVQTFLTLIILPYLASKILWICAYVIGITSVLAENILVSLGTSSVVQSILRINVSVGEALPDWILKNGIWKTLPDKIIIMILSMVLLPLMLNFIDGIFCHEVQQDTFRRKKKQ